MSVRAHRIVLAAIVIALVILHMDPWSDGSIEPVVWGFVPRDLGYHLLWVLAATATTFYMCAKAWPEDEP